MVAGPMNVTWLANTSQGRMVGDYISTSFNAAGSAHGVFAVATAPVGGVFDEAMFTTTAGVTRGGTLSGETAPLDSVPAGINRAIQHAARWH